MNNKNKKEKSISEETRLRAILTYYGYGDIARTFNVKVIKKMLSNIEERINNSNPITYSVFAKEYNDALFRNNEKLEDLQIKYINRATNFLRGSGYDENFIQYTSPMYGERLRELYCSGYTLSKIFRDIKDEELDLTEYLESYNQEVEHQYKLRMTVDSFNKRQQLKVLTQKHETFLEKNGWSKDKINFFCRPFNMESKFEELLFIAETLDLFGILDENIPLTSIRKIGGGYSSGGNIHGYNIEYNGKKYCIELDKERCTNKKEGTVLNFGKSNNPIRLEQEISLLKPFTTCNHSFSLYCNLFMIQNKLEKLESNNKSREKLDNKEEKYI